MFVAHDKAEMSRMATICSTILNANGGRGGTPSTEADFNPYVRRTKKSISDLKERLAR